MVVQKNHNFNLKHHKTIPTAILLPHKLHKTSSPITTTTTTTVNHHNNHPLPPPDFSLIDSYTSLKDILPSPPSSILSPTPTGLSTSFGSGSGSGSGYEISIRNRLVKQAAWAYLQPAVLSSPSGSSQRICEVFRPVVDELRRVVVESFGRVYDWLVDALWLILCR